MADKKINVVFDASVKANVGNLKGIVSKLQNELNNLEMPKGLTKNFEKDLEGLVKDLQTFESLAESGIGNAQDAKKITASWGKISGTLKRIGIQINDLKLSSGEIFSKQVSTNIEKANTGLDEYLKKVEQVRKTNKKYSEHKAEKDLIEQSLPDLRSDAKKRRKEANIAKTRFNNSDKVWREQYKADYESLEAERSSLSSQLELKKQEIENLKASRDQMRRKGIIEEKKNSLSGGGEKALELAKKIEEYDNAKREAEEASLKYQKALKSKSGYQGQYTKQVKKYGVDSEEAKQAYINWEKAKAAADAASDAMAQAKLNFESKQPITQKERDKLLPQGDLDQLKEAKRILDELKSAEEKASEIRNKLETKNHSSETQAVKRARDSAEKTYKTSEQFANAAEETLKDAEAKVSKLERELAQIESDGTVKEWQKLVNIIKELTGQDLSEAARDVEAFTKALEDYELDQLKQVPEELENADDAARSAASAMDAVSQSVDEATGAFKELTREQYELERFQDNILDFFSIGNTVQIFKRAIREAFDTVKELDAAMTETAVVTDFTISDMWEKLPEYSKTASSLGSSIKDLYNATTLYYQQGLNSEQAMGVGVETMKMARIANMEGAEATKAMTAALRGFNMEINETSAQRVSDVYSELAAITAADTQQIATAMSKTASIADSANMEFEATAALLAQIIETTQEAPETAGTALKTIIARFTEVKELFDEGLLTGEDEEGEAIDINRIDTALKTVGISLKDFLNGTRGIDDIFLELASKWDTLDLATQRYIATTAAGSRQQSRFIAMMSNYDRTMELVNAANNSAGASNVQFNKTLDSLDAKLERLNNAWQEFTMNLANNEFIKMGVDFLANFLETVNSITEALSGGNGMIKSILTLTEVVLALKTGKTIFKTLLSGFQKIKKDGFNFGSFLKGLYPSSGDSNDSKGYGLIPIYMNIFGSKKENSGIEKLFAGIFDSLDKLSLRMQAFSGSGLANQTVFDLIKDKAEELWFSFVKVDQIIEKIKALGKVFKGHGLTSMKFFGKNIMGFIATPLGKSIVTIGAIIASLAILKKAWEFGSVNNQLEILQKNMNSLKSSFEDGNNYLNEIFENKRELNKLEEQISNLAEGSLEWKEAVAELNEKVLELKQNYPELQLIKKDGLFSIDDSSWDKLIEKQKQSLEILSETKISIQLEIDKANLQKSFSESLQNINLPLLPSLIEHGQFFDNFIKSFTPFGIFDSIPEKNNLNIIENYLKDTLKTNENRLALLEKSPILKEIFENFANLGYEEVILTLESLISELDLYQTQREQLERELVSSSISSEINKENQPFIEGVLSSGEYNNFDRQLEKEISKVKTEDIFKNLKQIYGQEVGGYYENNKLYTDASKTQELNLSKQTMRQAIAVARLGEKISKDSLDLEKRTAALSKDQKDVLGELLSLDGEKISAETLLKYSTKKISSTDLFEAMSGLDELAQNLNFKDAQDMSNAVGISAFNLLFTLREGIDKATERIATDRKDLTKKMAKSSSKGKEGFQENAALLAALELKFGDYIRTALNDVFSQLELSGDNKLISAGYEAFRDIAMIGNLEQTKEAAEFISNIDWSNPIEAAFALNKELKAGSENTSNLAKQILKVDSSYLGSGSQMQYFLKSEDYSAMKEDLNEILATNGEIAATDILNLAGEYKSLDKVLQNTEATAGGLAKALEKIGNKEIDIDDLTDSVMASLGGFDSLNSMVSELLMNLSNFDAGPDENQVADFIKTQSDILNANIKKGAYGNSQNFKILDFFLGPGWDEGLSGTELEAKMKAAAADLSKNANNMLASWQELADLEDKTKLGKLKVERAGKGIDFTGFEGMTTDQVVTQLQEATGKSKAYAQMMLADFKNYSSELTQELAANDYAAGMEKAYKKLSEIKIEDPSAGIYSQKIIDEKDIATIAEIWGESEQKIRDTFQSKGALITNFYDEDGLVKSTQDVLNQLDIIAQSGGKTGANWTSQFMSQGEKGIALNVTKLSAALGQLGFPQEAQSRIIQDITNSMQSGAEDGQASVIATLSDGKEYEIEYDASIGVEQAIANAEKQLENANLADAIKSAFTELEVSVTGVNPASLAAIGAQIQDAVQEGANQIITFPSVDGTNITSTIQTAIDGANKTVKLTASMSPITVSVKGGASGIVRISAHKRGIINSPDSHDALVSEEGPELIQTADGAYLTGQNGPEVVRINKGDTVYTASQTKKILKGQSHDHIPRFALGYTGGAASGNGSGSGSGNKDESWENNIDKLYNLIQEISEEQHQRERIERRYELLLEGINSSAKKIIDISHEELAQLKLEKQLQENLIAGRLDQLAEYQQENSDLTKYAWTEQKVQEDGKVDTILRINWEEINKITNKDEGERVSNYLSQLEDWNDSINEGNDTLADIEETVLDIKKRGKEEYFKLEETIKDALIQSYQNEIDILSEIDESISETNSILIDSIQNSIEKMRQEREFQQTEEDLETMRRRLAYLQQDTSNANALEILNLRKEISEQEEDYTDSLIDQKISQLQEQNEKAQEQRQMQIEIAQLQLEHYEKTGEVWNDVYKLMNEGLDEENGLVRGSHLEALLKEGAGYSGLSEIGKMNWLEETNTLIANALAYFEIGRQLEDIGVKKGETIEFQTKDGKILSGIVDEKGNVQVGDKIYTNVFQGYDGKYYAGDEIEELKKPELTPTPTPTPTPTEKPTVDNTEDGSDQDSNKGPGGGGGDDDDTLPTNYSGYINAEKKDQEDAKKVAEAKQKEAAEAALRREQELEAAAIRAEAQRKAAAAKKAAEEAAAKKAAEEAARAAAIKKLEAEEKAAEEAAKKSKAEANQKKSAAAVAATTTTGYNITWPWQKKKYATGGLADFTGPAWLDGSKSRPEYVLNAEQTKNFFNLVDVLDSLKHKASNINASENGGEIIYDIDINIETVKEEADIDMLVDKVQKSITTASQYRNNTFIQR